MPSRLFSHSRCVDLCLASICVCNTYKGKVWRDLGLELRSELNVLQSNGTPSPNSIYNIQHTQQQAGLFVPHNVPCGYLSEFSCSFRYATTRTSRARGDAEESVPRPRNHTRYSLRSLGGASSEPRSVSTAAFWCLPPDVQAERVVHLTHNALSLLLGMRRRCLGIWCLQGTKPPALLELAPAVWNAQYFQVRKCKRLLVLGTNETFQNVVTRAQLIPTITSALGTLMSTQSPVLRQKIESLVPEPATGSGLDEMLDELHRRTQILLLRSARDQKTKACLPRVEAQRADLRGLILSPEDSSVPNTTAGYDFTNYASLELLEETLHGQESSQSHESNSGLPDRGVIHLEAESSHGFAPHREGSAEGSGISLAPEEDYVDSDMENAEWIDDDDVIPYTSENCLGYGGLYNEHCVGAEVLDLTFSEQEHQGHHPVPEDLDQAYDMEASDFYGENSFYGHYYEMSDVEGGVQPTARAFEGHCTESNRPARTWEYPGDDYSDFVGDEDRVIGDDIHEHLGGDDTYLDDGQNDPWETNNGYGQWDIPHGGDIDNEAGPDCITAAPVHHNDHAEAGQSNMRAGWHDQLLQDWSQVPRNYAYHGNEE